MTDFVVYKYPLDPNHALDTPPGTVRHVGVDPRGTPCVWIEHDLDQIRPDFPGGDRYTVVCTGEVVDTLHTRYAFVGTFVLAASGFVGHVYKRAER